ncbi:AsnC family transcriptional regulator [Acinetobacter qingfengensis]|uniref:Transcriptional regulator n=1 Tax=Acinetobacter qingfengensis TaxID=1262585 RepID=A0A1E7R913_9GAMM|nr:AsnC family transcriptional regulator [Acinetobacter qingfengensis]KAA8735571.1 AsnC family transcriptional regulator [Acinetobacter qingfengensis]OEY95781.1 transcriptional regulator [Acinetobacter qingfengensis]
MLQLDDIDQKIINLLQLDSRLSHKEIGQRVHRTGQAVGMRITQLIEQGIIQKYTITVNHQHKQFIQLYLNEQQSFTEVEYLVKQYSQIQECHKVLGKACYMVVSNFEPQDLNQFIEKISQWCRYSVETVIKTI